MFEGLIKQLKWLFYRNASSITCNASYLETKINLELACGERKWSLAYVIQLYALYFHSE